MDTTKCFTDGGDNCPGAHGQTTARLDSDHTTSKRKSVVGSTKVPAQWPPENISTTVHHAKRQGMAAMSAPGKHPNQPRLRTCPPPLRRPDLVIHLALAIHPPHCYLLSNCY